MSSNILRIYYATMENVSYTLFVLLLSLDNVIDIFFLERLFVLAIVIIWQVTWYVQPR